MLGPLPELGGRLLLCLAAWALAYVVCWHLAEDIFAMAMQPLLHAGRTAVNYAQAFEAFFKPEKVATISATIVSIPVIASQLWRLIAWEMHRDDSRALLPFLLATPLLFAIGLAGAYFVAVPVALHFVLGFPTVGGETTQLAQPAIGRYLSFVTQFLFSYGAVFLLPALLILLERAEFVNRQQLISARRYFIVGAFGLAAVLSPPDVVSQLLIALPIALLYEAAIISIRFVEHHRARAGQAAADG